MKKYKRLDLEQRYKIEGFISAGFNQSQIADQLGVHRSTISRELKRNTRINDRSCGLYVAVNAQSKSIKREREKPRYKTFTIKMLQYIRNRLIHDKWSPELISQRGRLELGEFISHEWIYQYIWTAKHSRDRKYRDDAELHKHLKHYGRRRKRKNIKGNRGFIPNRVSIENRPQEVEHRRRYGDYEVDFMMSKGNKPGLIVMTDRSTLMTHLIKTNTKSSKKVAGKIIGRLRPLKEKLKTQTFDNDMGFAAHEKIASRLEIQTYFTHPYTSQEKGTVENRIGVIRRFLPKKTDIQKINANEIKKIENKINKRPVRKFKYLTPIEQYYSLVALDT